VALLLGYLATEPSEYADHMEKVLDSYARKDASLLALRKAARAHASSFSDESFSAALEPLLSDLVHRTAPTSHKTR